MKDSTAAADKKEEVKKEEPYDPFFGQLNITYFVFRVQKDNGLAGEGRKGQGQQASQLINQIIEEAQEDFCTVRCRAHPVSLLARPL